MSPTMKTLALLPVAVALLAGCSSSDDDTPANETSSPGLNPGPAPTVLTKYDGEYLEACTADDPGDPDSGSEVVTLTISGDTAVSRVFNYDDAACQTPGTPAEIVFEVSVAYPGDTVETPQGTADAVNINVESVTLDGEMPTAEQQAQLTADNTYAIEYDIVLLEGSSLFFGDTDGELDGSTAENRPDTLDPVPTIRQ